MVAGLSSLLRQLVKTVTKKPRLVKNNVFDKTLTHIIDTDDSFALQEVGPELTKGIRGDKTKYNLLLPGNEKVGNVSLVKGKNNTIKSLINIEIDPTLRASGLGTKVIKTLAHISENKKGLEIKDIQKNAINFWRKIGLTDEAKMFPEAKGIYSKKGFIPNPDINTDLYKKSEIVKEQLKGTGFKDKPITELEQSIKNIDKGKQTVEGHAQLVEKLKPIRRWETSPTITQAEEIPLVLQKGKYFKDGKKNPKSGVYSLDLEIPEGQRTQARLDIPAYESYNKWIASLKTPGGKSGTFYSPTAVLKNVKFKPQTARAKKTGKGELPKEPFGVMDGEWVNHDPNQIKQLVDNILKENLEYVQVGYDPRRHGHFYIREDFGNFKKGTAIEEAEEVIQLGPLVLARNPKFSNVKEYEEGGRIMKDPNKNYNAQRFI